MRRVLAATLILGLALMGRTAAGRIVSGLGFQVPTPAGAITLADAPIGGGVVSPDPKSYYYNGRTFLTYVRGTTGAIGAFYYDHATGLSSAPNDIADLGSPDTHDMPSLMVRESDKRILTAFSRHAGAAMFIRRSLNPEDTLGAWPAAANIDSQLGGTRYTYPSLVQLRGVVNDPIYLFFRDVVGGVGRVCYSVSTDDGSTWAPLTVLFTAGVQFAGFRIGSDWDTKIGVMAVDGDSYSESTSLFYMELDGTVGTWHEADGSALTLPLGPADLTEVHDGDTGAAFPQGLMFDPTGKPAMIYHVNAGATNDAKRAYWNGSSWDVETIASVGLHPADRYSTGLSISFADPNVVFLGDEVGGRIENFRYERIGSVWTPEQITTGSPDDNAQIQSVTFADPSLQATWFQGSLVTSSNFNMKTMGWGE